ncbi:MAG: 2-oxoglutarate synthase, partial [Firmicutes bacterium]|nr:2-oxoglutarate synthase [Bacillota bacterium]
ITERVTAELGKALFANIVALGAIVATTKAVSVESITTAILHRVPKGTEDINKRALELGIALVSKS